MPKSLGEMAQEQKMALLKAILLSFVLDLVKHAIYQKLVEWGVERLGWLGRFFLDDPFAFVTATVVTLILLFIFLLVRERLRPTGHSLIVDKDQNPIPVRPSRLFTVITTLACLLVCVVVAYGGYRLRLTGNSRTTLRLVPPDGGWLPEWGQAIPPLGVRSIVNVSTLVPYRKPIPLMLIYLITDNTVDEQSDTRIVKSNIFAVSSNPRMTIDVQLPAEFINTGAQRYFAQLAMGKNELALPMKVALIAIPQRIKAEDISKISDASKFGGAVLTINGFPFPVEAEVTKRAGP